MTRKCALCKGTNYKRTYSFFSAPKDPEIRKKWQAVIPIPNYTVTDDTYICSKHFKSSDIITHWVSGVPPYVVKIKYKKCRLRVGAVPCLDFETNDAMTRGATQASRREEILANEMAFLIPRQGDEESIGIDSQDTESSIERIGEYMIVDHSNTQFGQNEYVDENDPYKTYVLQDVQTQDSGDSVDVKDNYFQLKYPQIHKVEGSAYMTSLALEENSGDNLDANSQEERERMNCEVYSQGKNMKVEQDDKVFGQEMTLGENEPAKLHEEENSGEASDSRIIDGQEESENKSRGQRNSESRTYDTMLFEDLLEIYTEVTLPRGWAFLVTSKGHSTTVVYLSMNMPDNDIPIVEKEVYIKSDMIMRCGVRNKEINPFLHSLVKDGRNTKVRALSDIEELIDELDQRQICEGGPNVESVSNIETQLSYVDGSKWRHAGCPIIINNGSSKCSKCVGLGSSHAGKRKRNTREPSLDMAREKDKEIERLRRSLKKVTRRNQRLEEIRVRFRHRFKLLLANSEKTIKSRISSSNMPDIQKLMIKECLKASVFKNRKNVRYSETWIFLCLLLYVESPRMYRYIFVNNYMTLPSMGTIRTYLNQIKTDPQFYNLFQRSVEPYQPIDEQDEEEPT